MPENTRPQGQYGILHDNQVYGFGEDAPFTGYFFR